MSRASKLHSTNFPKDIVSYEILLTTRNQYKPTLQLVPRFASNHYYVICCGNDDTVWARGIKYYPDCVDAREVPQQIPELKEIQGLCTNQLEVFCLDHEQRVWHFADFPCQILQIPSKVISMSCGKNCAFFITNNHLLYSYGAPHSERLGIPVDYGCKEQLRLVDGIEGAPTGVFSGNLVTFVLCSNGSIWSCGAGRVCRDTNEIPSYSFGMVVSASNVISISCYDHVNLFLLDDGTVYVYGPNFLAYYHFSSHVMKLPVSDIQQVAIMQKQCYFLQNDGTLLVYNMRSCAPKVVDGIPPITHIADSHCTAIARDVNGELWELHQGGIEIHEKFPDSFQNVWRLRSSHKSARK